MQIECDYTCDDVYCGEIGDHFCAPRALHVIKFIEELCVHTKGRYAGKPFILAEWQKDDIVKPMFGTTRWNEEHKAYARQYEIAWIEIARKNGKTELLAAFMLYLLVGEGERSGELFGIARNKEQATLCFDTAAQMVKLSPHLNKRLKITPHIKRIYDEKTHSFYQVIASDGAGALGSNPSGVAADEILAWQNGSMWEAMRTGMGSGARKQPMLIAATTAGNDSEGFAGKQHREMQRVLDEPTRAPHIFVYMRNTPKEADPFDEANWHYANPALGDFLSLEGMRRQAMEAKNDVSQENGFRQFKLNQWVTQTSRWVQMHMYDASGGQAWPSRDFGWGELQGRECWMAFDLAARQDMTAITYLFPNDDGTVDLIWRFYMPEVAFLELNKKNGGRLKKWAEEGWITVTSGNVLDFDVVYSDIESDAQTFTILGADCDSWSSDPVIQEITKRTNIKEIFSYKNDFGHMNDGMKYVLDLIKEEKFNHHFNPVARWQFDAVEARTAVYDPDLIRPDKPMRSSAAKRIDGVVSSIMATKAYKERGFVDTTSVYDLESETNLWA